MPKLTARKVETAQPKKDRLYYLNAGDGLRLQVRPNGSKYWLLRYRLAGKESTTSLGVYPDVGLAEALGKARAVRRTVSEGRSPSVQRKIEKIQTAAREATTFAGVAADWLETHENDWSAHHRERNGGLLRRILLPVLGSLPIHEIKRDMLLGVLETAYKGGTRESARRARAVAAQIFEHAIDAKLAEHNPAAELRGSKRLRKPEVRHFKALPQSDVGPMLRALEESDAALTTKTAILLMLYTGVRDAALRATRWTEFDLDAATWTLPGARRKRSTAKIRANPEPLLIPLPSQAVSILLALKERPKSDPGDFVFASHGKAGFLAENTLRIALHRLGFKVTAHGFRSLITDVLNERAFNRDAIERQLDHVIDRNAVRAAYLRSDFLDQRRPMMQWFADWCDAQKSERRDPKIPGNVVALIRA